MTAAEQRPAQQSPDWDPTVADPLTVLWHDDGDQCIGRYCLNPAHYIADPELRRYLRAMRVLDDRKPGVSRAVLVWGFAALVVVLAIVSAALFAAGLPR